MCIRDRACTDWSVATCCRCRRDGIDCYSNCSCTARATIYCRSYIVGSCRCCCRISYRWILNSRCEAVRTCPCIGSSSYCRCRKVQCRACTDRPVATCCRCSLDGIDCYINCSCTARATIYCRSYIVGSCRCCCRISYRWILNCRCKAVRSCPGIRRSRDCRCSKVQCRACTDWSVVPCCRCRRYRIDRRCCCSCLTCTTIDRGCYTVKSCGCCCSTGYRWILNSRCEAVRACPAIGCSRYCRCRKVQCRACTDRSVATCCWCRRDGIDCYSNCSCTARATIYCRSYIVGSCRCYSRIGYRWILNSRCEAVRACPGIGSSSYCRCRKVQCRACTDRPVATCCRCRRDGIDCYSNCSCTARATIYCRSYIVGSCRCCCCISYRCL